ncbi:MAG: RagB/SusD family nutrient uptake outer membrane protein [Rikenellaceae bacterium]
MKSNIIKNIAIVMASMMTLSGCNDYLTEEDPNEVTTDSFWEDLSDTQAGVYAAMAALRNEYVVDVRFEAWRCDQGWPGYGRPVPQNNATGWTWYTQQYTNSTSGITNKWDGLYVGVWRCNQVIEALEALNEDGSYGGDEATWTYQMAEVRFLRGLYYFFLHSSFNEGSVVLRTKCPVTVDDFNQPLAPADEVLEFFREDLKYAYDNLPAYNETGSIYVGMPTSAAAAAFLGTSYLYEKEYDEAKSYFYELIYDDKYGLELVTDMDKLFTMAGEFNSESIFEISYSADERTDIDTWDDNRMVNPLETYSLSTTGFLVPAWLVYEYYNETMDTKQEDNTGRQVSKRASAMVALVRDEITPYYITGNAAEYGNYGGPTGEWGYGRYKKYTNHDIVEQYTSLQSGRNVILSRLADVYLMYAECLLQDDDVQGAIDAINEVRKRWNLTLLGTSKDSSRTYNGWTYDRDRVMEHLMYVERPLELSVEGHQIRWQDLRRWGLLEDDSNNIFKRHSDEIFYSTSSSGLSGLSGTALSASFPNSYIQKTAGTGSNDQKVDYEYDAAYVNYNKSRNAYYPIPSTEIMNNSMVN